MSETHLRNRVHLALVLQLYSDISVDHVNEQMTGECGEWRPTYVTLQMIHLTWTRVTRLGTVHSLGDPTPLTGIEKSIWERKESARESRQSKRNLLKQFAQLNVGIEAVPRIILKGPTTKASVQQKSISP